jgi:hypothetical protein
MKKIFLLALAVILAIFGSSCALFSNPVGVTEDYFTACKNGDQAAALSLLIKDVRDVAEMVGGGNPCVYASKINGDITQNIFILSFTEKKTEGNKSLISVLATWDVNTVELEAVLHKESDGWKLADAQVIHSDISVREEAKSYVIPFQEITQENPNLMEGLTYTSQEGVNGSGSGELVRHVLDGQTVEEHRENDVVVQAPVNKIIAQGTQPTEQTQEAARTAGGAYLMAWQTGDYATMQNLTVPDTMPNIDLAYLTQLTQLAGLTIESVDVKPADDVHGTKRGNEWPAPETKCNFVSGGQVAQTPYTIEGELSLRQSEHAGWQAVYWGLTGVTAASADVQKEYQSKGEIFNARLNLFAAFTDRTFISLALLPPSPARNSLQVSFHDEFNQDAFGGNELVDLVNQSFAGWMKRAVRPDA